ncbi:type VII secretion-associated protein [Pseudonocardia sp. RS010]|uniref:type VII secretion-associated protein n=1 Tax=Pseudonocardia sp. RS010 TaxID=3385979 RepID=UPI00399F2438
MTCPVESGRGGTRVAGREEGRPVLLGVLPAGVPPGAAAAALLPGARALRPAHLPGLVVDAGAGGTRVLRDGRPVRHIPVGGLHLDAAVRTLLPAPPRREADVRELRETLSLLPAATIGTEEGRVRVTAEQVRAALTPLLGRIVDATAGIAGRPEPVLLVGGVARTPLLAELLDRAGVAPVTVAPRPEVAALLATPDPPRRAAEPEDRAAPRPPLPPPPPVRRRRTVLAAVGAVVAAVGLLGLGLLLPGPLPADRLVQYGYELAVPVGWAHVGGAPEHRRTLLAPVAQPDGTGLVAVERTPLGYDAGTEGARARAELRERYDRAVATGVRLEGFREEGGALRYREIGGPATVEWHVRLEGTDQISVGCRYPPGGSAAVERACAVVVASVRVRG